MAAVGPDFFKDIHVDHLVGEGLTHAFHFLLDEVDEKAEEHLRFDYFSQFAQFSDEAPVELVNVRVALVEQTKDGGDGTLGGFAQIVEHLGVVGSLVVLFVVVGALLELAFLLLSVPLFPVQLKVRVFDVLQHFLCVGQFFQAKVAVVVDINLLALRGSLNGRIHELLLQLVFVHELVLPL